MDQYFEDCETSGHTPTFCGLAAALGVYHEKLQDYASRQEYEEVIKTAWARIEAVYEQFLIQAATTAV